MFFHYKLARKCGPLKLRTCWEDHIDEYDLTDPKVRQNLIDIGFVAKVRENP